MNNYKISFIICSNDSEQLTECIYYINNLNVPPNYEIELIEVNNQTSIFAGYNEGMSSTDSKYKIYMHQDVRIINPNFLYDLLNIFQDKTVGLIGMVGASILYRDPWHWDAGSIIEVRETNISLHNFARHSENAYVSEVDGLLMATQYDIPWREDLLSGWDFYDRSQSIEFTKQGYRIVVPYQSIPWCIHDCGLVSINDYLNRQKTFFSVYGEYLIPFP